MSSINFRAISHFTVGYAIRILHSSQVIEIRGDHTLPRQLASLCRSLQVKSRQSYILWFTCHLRGVDTIHAAQVKSAHPSLRYGSSSGHSANNGMRHDGSGAEQTRRSNYDRCATSGVSNKHGSAKGHQGEEI
jgi:hypothetical protein